MQVFISIDQDVSMLKTTRAVLMKRGNQVVYLTSCLGTLKAAQLLSRDLISWFHFVFFLCFCILYYDSHNASVIIYSFWIPRFLREAGNSFYLVMVKGHIKYLSKVSLSPNYSNTIGTGLNLILFRLWVSTLIVTCSGNHHLTSPNSWVMCPWLM